MPHLWIYAALTITNPYHRPAYPQYFQEIDTEKTICVATGYAKVQKAL